VYGIIKGQVQRAVVKYTQPPDKQPLTVCFHFPGTFLTHRYVLDSERFSSGRGTDNDDDEDDDEVESPCYVLDMMRVQLKAVDDGRVKTIQFVDRNTIHGTQVNITVSTT